MGGESDLKEKHGKVPKFVQKYVQSIQKYLIQTDGHTYNIYKNKLRFKTCFSIVKKSKEFCCKKLIYVYNSFIFPYVTRIKISNDEKYIYPINAIEGLID